MIIDDFHITKHAISRALDMGVSADEVRRCLLHPETMVKSQRHPGHNYRAGRITCAVSPGKQVLTVVWSSPDGWREDLEGAAVYGGRAYRHE